MNSILKRVRVRQIQFCARWLRRFSGVPSLFAAIKLTRELPAVRQMLILLTGYSRPFPTLNDAAAAISGYEGGGHSNPNYLAAKIPEAEKPRQGDYAALFHIERVLPHVRNVFDLGGSVGNLYYCYVKYLDMPADLIWKVCELPETVKLGEQVASSNNVQRLRFTCRGNDADGTDLFIVSGALHYFEQPLPDMIAGLTNKPRYILVNRAALIDGAATATVQDGDTYRLPCILHDRNALVRGLEGLGYEVVDSWDIRGLSVIIPCYPDRSAKSYSGLFFRMRGAASVSRQ
jgi:putative methyltransferase (TIGR04325 family)